MWWDRAGVPRCQAVGLLSFGGSRGVLLGVWLRGDAFGWRWRLDDDDGGLGVVEGVAGQCLIRGRRRSRGGAGIAREEEEAQVYKRDGEEDVKSTRLAATGRVHLADVEQALDRARTATAGGRGATVREMT